MQDRREVTIINPTISIGEENKVTKIAAYCRVSTDSEEQSNSFLAQFQYYSDFAKSRSDVELIDIYADEGITGTCVSKREDFQRMMRDAKAGRFERLLTKSVSRFARNSLECLENIRKLNSYGVTVLFENDNIDTKSMNSELILYVKSAFAQSEALAGSKRVSTAIRMKMENGEFSTFTAPYGFCLEDKKLKIIPEEAEVVKQIFDWYSKGLGISKITAKLKEEHPERIWTNSGINYILTNEKYIGDSLLQKTYTPQIFPLRNRPNNGELDKFYVTNTHEGFIDKALFESVKEKLTQNGERIKERKKTKSESVFSGMVFCEECGWQYKERNQNGKTYWVCSRKSLGGFKCSGANISEDSLKQVFILMFNKVMTFKGELIDGTINRLNAIRNKMLGGNIEISQIDSEIAAISEQNGHYNELRALDIIDEVSFLQKESVFKKRLATLRKKRSEILNGSEEEIILSEAIRLQEMLDTLPKCLFEFDEKAFELIVEKVIVGDKGQITFAIKGGFKFEERI